MRVIYTNYGFKKQSHYFLEGNNYIRSGDKCFVENLNM